MIDFNATFDLIDGTINFCNYKNEIVKSYTMKELEDYVIENRLNTEIVSVNGCFCMDPNIIEEEEEIPVMTYIEENWLEVTKDFYLDRNPTENISNNKIQQTKKDLA